MSGLPQLARPPENYLQNFKCKLAGSAIGVAPNELLSPTLLFVVFPHEN